LIDMAEACPTCGAEGETGRFCSNCGAQLDSAGASQSSERRVVTVVFVDLVGFTARAELLDPEDVQAILTPYHSRVRRELEACGGTVEKFIGDAIVAVFGAPVAHGDDPERAVRAALAARDAVAEMNEGDAELDLQVRIAVNTGEAVVTLTPDPATGEGMVTGDVVNTASRLQGEAPVNRVLVGEETYRTTRSQIDFEAVPPVVVKGKREPLQPWLAVGPATQPGERRTGDARLVGRDAELDTLRGAWSRVVAERRPQLVTIFGPAGIGKTRLATEFIEHLTAEGGLALRGRSVPYGGRTAYGPFANQVKQVARIYDSDPAPVAFEKLGNAVAELVEGDTAEITSHLALLVGLEGGSDVGDRQTLFLSARRFVEGLAAAHPAALIFEDLHWADESMLDLLEVLASRIRDLPLLLVALARPELLSTRAGWGGGLPAYTALPLEPLGSEHSRELAAELLGRRLPEDSRAPMIAETAEGNPLFIEELAASLGEQATADRLPTTIHGIIAARLDAVPPEERSFLLDASVVGKVFWLGALEQLGWERGRALDVIDSLEGRDLVRREPISRIQGDQQLSFKHGLIRDVAYATLPRAERRERHAHVAQFLEDRTTEMGAAAAAVAEHWRESGEPTRAVRFLMLAADQAGRGWAKEEAVALYREAATLVPQDDAELRREIMRRFAVAEMAMFHIADARRLARAQAEAG
jgi:class 3 adenylate cyclase